MALPLSHLHRAASSLRHLHHLRQPWPPWQPSLQHPAQLSFFALASASAFSRAAFLAAFNALAFSRAFSNSSFSSSTFLSLALASASFFLQSSRSFISFS